jgi:hypothetical protein
MNERNFLFRPSKGRSRAKITGGRRMEGRMEGRLWPPCLLRWRGGRSMRRG